MMSKSNSFGFKALAVRKNWTHKVKGWTTRLIHTNTEIHPLKLLKHSWVIINCALSTGTMCFCHYLLIVFITNKLYKRCCSFVFTPILSSPPTFT